MSTLDCEDCATRMGRAANDPDSRYPATCPRHSSRAAVLRAVNEAIANPTPDPKGMRDALDAIDARAEAATPGPWVPDHEFGHVYPGKERGRIVCTLDDPCVRNAENDLEFIAHAREDIDALRAEVRRLRTILEGRTTPPTEEELLEHYFAGGVWLVALAITDGALPALVVANHYEASRYARQDPKDEWTATRWIAVGADRRPCAWPTATDRSPEGNRHS